MKWLTLLWTYVLQPILGNVLGGTKDPAAAERKAGQDLGRAEVERDNAQAGLNELQRASNARPDPAPADGVRDGRDSAAKPYHGGPD